MGELFSEKVVTGRRTYFFDVKANKEGALYLVIGELTQVGTDTERHRVMLFEENLESFMTGLQKAVAYIRESREEEPVAAGFDPEVRGGGEMREVKAVGAKSLKELLVRLGQARPSAAQEDEPEGSLRATLQRIEMGVNDIRRHFRA